MVETLFRNERLCVRRVVADGAGPDEVITFDKYDDVASLDRPGFGQDFFRSRGITATHVVAAGNDWYQYPEMMDVFRILRAATATARRVMTYGSSMGGYAAIRFAEAVGAHATLALSPQYSIDPAKIPFEKRWGQDMRRIRILPDLDRPVRLAHWPVVAFDPIDTDGEHARLIAAETPVALLPVPFAGHPVGTYLSEADLLTDLVLDTLAGTFDLAAMQHRIRRCRSTLSLHFAELANRQPAVRPRLALALAQRAVDINPVSHIALLAIARQLIRQNRHDEGVAAYERLSHASERTPAYLIPHSEALYAARRLEEALVIAQEVQIALPDLAGGHYWVAYILRDLGRREDALSSARTAVLLDPGNIHYRKLLWTLRFPLLASLLTRWTGNSTPSSTRR